MPILRTIRSGQTIFYQGEATARVHLIKSGLVRSYIIHDNGEEATVAYFGPKDIFPITSAFNISSATLFYYETVTDSEIEVLTPKEFDTYLNENNHEEVNRFAMRYVGALLHVSALTQPTASMKLAHTLRYLAIQFGEKTAIGNRVKITLKLTQQDLAKLCNLSRETVSIELSSIKKNDILIVKEKFYFIHIAKLNNYINEDTATDIRLN